MLNLHHVETWLSVLATGSFQEASRRLGLAQSTVSQHVQKGRVPWRGVAR
ncbi:LysR family transcriptional regulator [Methylobacterium aquaticum]